MTILKNQAIQTALTGDWNNAIFLNQELLRENPNDIETLNRLAFAFSITGKIKAAKNTYKKVLDLDSQNPIALKNLKRLSGDKKNTINSGQSTFLSGHIDNMFLEESGKTKIIELLNIATADIITKLMTGEPLTLRIKRLKIFVLNRENLYIGVLPDDIGRRLIRFLNGGNAYEAYVKSVEEHHVVVFIKETKRAGRFKNQPSFVSPVKTHFVLDKNQNLSNSLKQDSQDKSKDYVSEDLDSEEEEELS